MIRDFNGSNDASVVQHANFGLRKRFVRNDLFGECVLGRLSATLVKECPVRPPLFAVGRPCPHEAVRLIHKRGRRVNVRVLRVCQRIKGKLNAIRGRQGALLVNGDGRLLSKVSHARRVKGVHRASGPNAFKRRLPVFIRWRFTLIVRQGRLSNGSALNNGRLPKGGITVIFRREGGRLVPLLRGFLAGTKSGRISALHHAANRSGLVHTTDVSRASRHLAQNLIRLYDLLQRRIRSTVRVNVRQVVFIHGNVCCLTEFLHDHTIIRVSRQLTVCLAKGSERVDSGPLPRPLSRERKDRSAALVCVIIRGRSGLWTVAYE